MWPRKFFTANSATATTTATAVVQQRSKSFTIFVPTGGATVFIGGPGVTTATGFPLAGGAAYSSDGEIERLYFVVAAATQAFNWIVSD